MTMKRNLSSLSWRLAGMYPFENYLGMSRELGEKLRGEFDPFEVSIPSSVQSSLLKIGVLPDWNYGLNARACEWVENRFWIYATKVPKEWFSEAGSYNLICEGLDYNGEIFFNGQRVYAFANALMPHTINLDAYLGDGSYELKIVFHTPPRWQGQFGHTSKFTELKARYNYWWDWTSRLVQIGISGNIHLECVPEAAIRNCLTRTQIDEAGKASLELEMSVEGNRNSMVEASLSLNGKTVVTQDFTSRDFLGSMQSIDVPDAQLWWPHGMGDQVLYDLVIELKNKQGETLDRLERKLGFRSLVWHKNEKADHADPWILAVNGRKIFLTGINWTPIKPNYADVKRDDYESLMKIYQEHGIRLFRVWGGAFLETQDFYELCDEYGFLVWQEFPLSSSGTENCPPDTEEALEKFLATAESYIRLRHHHASHLMWCGGNELREFKTANIPITNKHPMIAGFEKLVQKLDPHKRFIPSTPCGPTFAVSLEDVGKGLHWAVNGPWKAKGRLEDEWSTYFGKDDSLIRTEIGAPGPSDAALIRKYQGELNPEPCTNENPLWRRQSWWTEEANYRLEHNDDEPTDLDKYVTWGQERQKQALLIAAENCLRRFPECGGIIFWMGHDSFPCTANTSLIDFEGGVKPALTALAELWKRYPEETCSEKE
jgi:beta-mannosidase